MKKELALVILVLVSTSSFAQKSTTLTVIIKGAHEPKAFLQKDQESISANLIDGRYEFEFSLEADSFFDFGCGNSGSEIYFEPGDNLTLSADHDSFDMTLKYSGARSKENTYLHERNLKRKVYAPLLASIRTAPEILFLDSLNLIVNMMQDHFDSFQKHSGAMSSKFKKYERANFNFIRANQKSVFVNNYGNNHRDGTTVSEQFNDYLKDLQYNDASLLPSPRFRDFLRNIRYNETFKLIAAKPYLVSPETDHINAMFIVIDSLFTDASIKNYALYTTMKFELRQLGLAVPKESVDAFYEKCTNKSYIAEIKGNYLIWTSLRKGVDAPSFTVVDNTGKQNSLKDFKGKYVFIDVWATWCGPCIKEMPAMASLASEYKDNADIVFLKISIDANKQVWEKKTAKEQDSTILTLWAENGANSAFAKAYAIKDIPRYILIDKEGKIVDAQALAPSQIKDKLEAIIKNTK